MTVPPRSHLSAISPVLHGSISDHELAALGLARSEVIDFSLSANPLGPSPAAVEAARAATLEIYPDDASLALRRALARRDAVSVTQVILGNGSAELIWLVVLTFLDPGAPAVVVGPTFGEYARAVRIGGGAVYEHRADAASGFAVDPDAVVALGRSTRARLLFLCNPNNPTGRLLPVDALHHIAANLPDTLLVVDEAYRQLADEPPATVPLLDSGNVLLLRSLTKDYALPGLRLGYALASEDVRAALDKVRPPWNVNAVAQAAGLAALRDEIHLERARAEIRRARAYLLAEFAALGFPVIPAAANFLLVEVGDGATARAALLRHGICVRDCASFGLPAHVRVGLRALPECRRLVETWRQVQAARLRSTSGG